MMNHRGVFAYLGQVYGGKTVSGLSESDLLGRFVTTGDETAFTALVIRHGPMVLGVCRRLLRDVNDVEDAFQATFLVLARRAGAIQRGHLLAPWLHGVAHRVAVRARAKRASRNARELTLDLTVEVEDSRGASPSEELSAKELRGLLDDELARLPESLRKPLVLCYLEGLTHDEAARELRWPVGTVRSRMARGRTLLRNRLARQGHSASGLAIVGNLSREIVPRTLLEATVSAALGFTTGKIPASATALALAKGVIGLMLLQKAMIVGVVVLGATVSVAGAYGYQAQGPGADSKVASEPAKQKDQPGDRNSRKVVEYYDGPITEQVMALQRALEETTDKLNKLRDDYKKLGFEVDRIRGFPQVDPATGTQGDALTMAGMMGSGGRSANHNGVDQKSMMRSSQPEPDENRLTFVRQATLVCVVSPEGNRVTEFDLETNKSYVIEFPKGLKALPFTMMGMMTAIGFRPIDKDSEIKQLAVFDKVPVGAHLNPGQKGSGWMTKNLDTPYKGTVTPRIMIDAVFFELGNQIHTYSRACRSWSLLTLPEGPHSKPTVEHNLLIYEAQGHLHIYDSEEGKWVDINSREAEPKTK